ncbi:MAG: hypothetical protein WC860_03680 [Candidatus Margulisiibacteriota bacterium]|jgi:hypothetical protein
MNFSEAIKQIAQKKDCLTEKALRAKEEYDQIKNQFSEFSSVTVAVDDIRQKNIMKVPDFFAADKISKKLTKEQREELQEFTESVNLLSAIIRKAKLDELDYLVANPLRLLILNFFVGLVRGVAFTIGALFICLILVYLLLISLEPNTLRLLLAKIF